MGAGTVTPTRQERFHKNLNDFLIASFHAFKIHYN